MRLTVFLLVRLAGVVITDSNHGEDDTRSVDIWETINNINNRNNNNNTEDDREINEHINHQDHEVTRDESHPLLTLMTTRPHSMSFMVKVRDGLKPEMMLKLLYERVPLNKQPYFHHLDDPVIEYIHLERSPFNYDLYELPKGKYIVCGEAMVQGVVYQASCFETRIERLDNNTLQTGVKVIIIISIVMVVLVVIYAIFYRLFKGKMKK